MKNPAGGYQQQNWCTAESILKDPRQYGGPESLMVRWAQPMLNRESHQAERFPERRRHDVATSYFSRAFFFALRAARAAVEAFFARATRSSGVMDADAFFARATRASGVIAAAAFFPPLLP